VKEEKREKERCTNLAVEVNKLMRASNATQEPCDLRHPMDTKHHICFFKSV
jgi:hypothetical protein